MTGLYLLLPVFLTIFASFLIDTGLLVPLQEQATLPQLSIPGTSDYDNMVTCLKEQMGYPKAKAEEAAKYVTDKYANETLEDKKKHALSYLSGGIS